MGSEKEINTVKEQAVKREIEIMGSIERLRQETESNRNYSEIPISNVLNQPQQKTQVYTPVNSEINSKVFNVSNKKEIDDSKTWKEIVDKRKSDKKR